MFIGAAIFLVLIVMGGVIAFLGDRIGSKVGKKRMTLFGLRPKYTSVIVTIISGVLISFSTVAVMAVVNENVRVALFGLSKLQTRMNVVICVSTGLVLLFMISIKKLMYKRNRDGIKNMKM